MRTAPSETHQAERLSNDEPIRLGIVWPIGAMLAILYGSLIPFTFDVTAAGNAGIGSGLHWRGTTIEDIITNIVVYLPVGCLIVLSTISRRIGSFLSFLVAAAAGLSLSLAAESLQCFIAVRVASLTDVLLNSVGTVMGGLLGCLFSIQLPGILHRVRRSLTANPCQFLAKIITMGLIFYGLAPFDFATDSASLHHSLLSARWNPFASAPNDDGATGVRLITSQLSTAIWFAILCYLFARARLGTGRRLAAIWIASLRHGLLVAGLIEVLQLFTVSHAFDALTLVIQATASAFGAGCAVLIPLFFSDGFRQGRRQLPIGTPVLVGLCALQVILLQLGCVEFHHSRNETVQQAYIAWVPFEAIWHRPMFGAGAELLGTLMAYGTLAASFALVLRRAKSRRVWIITGFAVLWVAVTVKMVQLAASSHVVDLTDLVMAIVAVSIVAKSFSILHPTRERKTLSPVESTPSIRFEPVRPLAPSGSFFPR